MSANSWNQVNFERKDDNQLGWLISRCWYILLQEDFCDIMQDVGVAMMQLFACDCSSILKSLLVTENSRDAIPWSLVSFGMPISSPVAHSIPTSNPFDCPK